MTWRRKALLATIVMGATVVGLRPFLSYAIGNRIAADWHAQASVQNTELSLREHAVFLKNLQISDPSNTIRIQELALRLDGYAALFRNGVVESLVGKGLYWEVRSDAIAKNQARQGSTSYDNSPLELTPHSRESGIDQIKLTMERAVMQLSAIERMATNNTANIDRRIVELQTRIENADTPESRINPLRQSHLVDELRSELLILQQSLAEDRLQAKESEKMIEDVTKEAEAILKRLSMEEPSSAENASVVARKISDETVARMEAKLMAYADASQFVFERLAGLSPNLRGDLKVESSNGGSTGVDLVLDDLEPRVTRIKKGKISGKCSVDGVVVPVKITISGADVFSSRLFQPAVGIVWEMSPQDTSANSDINLSTIETSITIDRTINSKSPSIVLNLHAQTTNGQVSLSRVLQSNQTIDRWSIPMEECRHSNSANGIAPTKSLQAGTPSLDWLCVTSTITMPEASKTQQTDPASLNGLEAWVSTLLKDVDQKQRESTAEQARKLVQTSLEQMKRKQSALMSTQAARQQGWASQLQVVDQEVLELKEIIRRTTRKNSSVLR